MEALASKRPVNRSILQRRFTDIDRFTEQLQSLYKLQMTQLSVEALQCHFLLAKFDEVQFTFVKSSCPIFTVGEKPKDAVSFSYLLEVNGSCIISHNRRVCHNTLLGFDSKREVRFVLPPNMQYVVVQIKRSILQDYLEVMDRQDLDERFWESNYLYMPETISIVKSYLRQLLYLMQHQTHLFQQAQIKTLLLEDFIPLLISTIPPVTQATLKPPPLIPRSPLVKAAEEYMMAHLGQPLTLKQLCKTLHTSERPLFYGFQEVFGVSPMEYLKIQRLQSVRQKLKLAHPKTDSVMAIAQQFGFWSAGHFSRDYKKMFGELPSDTLRNMSLVKTV